MQQYLINATAIWLLSLLLYDVLLRKESFHTYNRVYLVGTLLLGALLPLWEWQGAMHILMTDTTVTVQNMRNAKHAVVATMTPNVIVPQSGINWQLWLTVLYLLGAVVAVTTLLVDVVRLIAFTRKGSRSFEDGWTVIETAGSHAPFSFFRTLYVSSRAQYSIAEWQMILSHEGRHASLLHVLDLVLLQVARIIFWFHPLVYVYNKRLLLVHEYQADDVPAERLREYGTFLIEQALLQSAPVITHAFNSGSVRYRISMLSRKSSGNAKAKLLLVVPLVVICLACFTKDGYANGPHKEGSKCTWRGNVIEFRKPKQPDSYMHRNEKTGKLERMPIGWPEPPEQLNGEPIYDGERKDVISSSLVSKENGLAARIMKEIQKEVEQLEDGEYFILISDVVVDKGGRVAYYENKGILKNGVGDGFELKNKIDEKISSMLQQSTTYTPANLNGSAVACYYRSLFPDTYGYGGYTEIEVRNHTVKWIAKR